MPNKKDTRCKKKMPKHFRIISGIFVLIAIVTIISGCGKSNQSVSKETIQSTNIEQTQPVKEEIKPTEEIKEEPSNAYKLAFVEIGAEPSQLLVNQFDSLLKTLNKKCTEGEQKISDIIVKTQELLEKKNKKETLLNIARSVNESIPKELTNNISCAEIAAFLVVLTAAE